MMKTTKPSALHADGFDPNNKPLTLNAMNQNTTNPPHSQKAPIPRPVLTFADTDDGLRTFCPACGEFALEIDEANKQPIVKCSHCGFQSPLNRFTVQHRDAMHVPDATRFSVGYRPENNSRTDFFARNNRSPSKNRDLMQLKVNILKGE